MMTFVLLTLSLLSLWVPSRPSARWPLWLVLFGAALAGGVLEQVVLPAGIVLVGLLGVACRWLDDPGTARSLRPVLLAAIVILAVVFFVHVPWGFANLPVVRSVRLAPDALPYALYFNFDKAVAGLFLLGLGHPRIARREDLLGMLKDVAVRGSAVIGLVLTIALVLQFVRLDVKWPSFLAWWLWANLFFTCAAEEAFFRGFIQRRLVRRLSDVRFGAWWGILAAALLFGAAHYGGGARYVFLATVAGLGYGWVYHKRGQIESSILVHFLLNTAHLLFFSYPARIG